MKKELFKYLITEFHEKELPKTEKRELNIPATKKIITLTGPRRAGKTFYFYQLIKDLLKTIPKERIIYINFEDDRILPLNIKELDGILEAYYEMHPENKGKELFLFFDEIQNIIGWEIYIRRINDTENARIFVTGSSSKLLSREIATSLRGRTIAFEILPLSFKELLRFKKIIPDKKIFYSTDRYQAKQLFEHYLNYGGFPEIVLENNNLEYKILENYFKIMIFRDIVERFKIRNLNLLTSLAKFLLTNISTVFSINSYYHSLKETSAVGKETLFEYVAHLEEANVIFLVPIFGYSLKAKQTNPKKIYCVDNGLRNAVSFKFSKDEGKLAENLVFIELKRREKEISYWKNKGEVDFVIKNKDNTLTAINVSYADEINERELKSLLEFKKEFNKTKELIVLTKDTEKTEKGMIFIPLWKWLLEQ